MAMYMCVLGGPSNITLCYVSLKREVSVDCEEHLCLLEVHSNTYREVASAFNDTYP